MSTAEEIADFILLCDCPGVAKCQRSKRALVCRTFPFEAHLDEKGKVLGITYQYDSEEECVLVGKPRHIYNPAYIRNSVIFWEEVLEIFPEEKELYFEESAKLRRKFKREGRTIQIFR